MPSKFSVVLLNYNGANRLSTFLPILIEHTPLSNIYLIDNASTDDSLSCVHQYLIPSHCIPLQFNKGYAAGYNRGLDHIPPTDYYILLNTDVEVTAGWWQDLISYMQANPQVGACQPKLKNFRKRTHFDYAGAAGGKIFRLGYPYCRGRFFGSTEEDKGQYDQGVEISWASGACLCLRRDAFEEIGGFDESFFMYVEEIDLCWRLKNKGYAIRSYPQVTVYHDGEISSPLIHPRGYYVLRNNYLLMFKHFSTSQKLWILPLRWIIDWAMAFGYLFLGHLRPMKSYLKVCLYCMRKSFSIHKPDPRY
ncbi:MAG: glycosyltransferase family 2 protein [Cytophagales bacterium]|nr:glycosyltransferase family 2 protein [Cytophagales bacterium]